ncbi:MAG: hypothetical protein GY927_16835 [bacterium]|nr:hypothetical protein [bacterium]
MVEKTKTGKRGKSKPSDEQVKSESNPDIGGLTASLEALVSIADEGEKRTAGDVVQLSARTPKDCKGKERSKKKSSAQKKRSSSRDKVQMPSIKDAEIEDAESLGVVELLGALKSDIDSLRQDNEEFKVRLLSSPLARSNSALEAGDDKSELHTLLEALKADIGNLREENDQLRTEAFAAQDNVPTDESGDEELYGMLAELKDDIVSMRTENDALRAGDLTTPSARSAQNSDDVTMVLRELKSDINDLKHDNESLRLENLTARDGAYFDNLGGQYEAYRNDESSVASGLLKIVGALALALTAGGGGYYFAKTQGGMQVPMNRSMSVPATGGNIALNQPSGKSPPRVKPLAPVVKPVTAPVKIKTAKAPPVPVTALNSTVSLDVETAMMARASGLMEARDIGSARMVFVYLARHGSAVAMTRLAQTYDPQFLGLQGFDAGKNGDLVRAKRLYGAASGMGDQEAATRLQEMQ